ncbi:hypothetical protein POVWA2_086350 [Plasmodium ovale wallikeri]|uniref:Uncharacterized protein n=1 Tax=Plasmodium ovale wallikeri TaxID=864142 RepID=A0A1A9AR02_PLAOA|nr:hypothetical protein POVWA1_084950 [Plasmodium ovale wallikeri]SBT58666.1 hypothetical protein POVWA2_086350 [Plasmodium ovale wallikeri]
MIYINRPFNQNQQYYYPRYGIVCEQQQITLSTIGVLTYVLLNNNLSHRGIAPTFTSKVPFQPVYQNI